MNKQHTDIWNILLTDSITAPRIILLIITGFIIGLVTPATTVIIGSIGIEELISAKEVFIILAGLIGVMVATYLVNTPIYQSVLTIIAPIIFCISHIYWYIFNDPKLLLFGITIGVVFNTIVAPSWKQINLSRLAEIFKPKDIGKANNSMQLLIMLFSIIGLILGGLLGIEYFAQVAIMVEALQIGFAYKLIKSRENYE